MQYNGDAYEIEFQKVREGTITEDPGAKMQADGGTMAARWWHHGGTMVALWRYDSGTMAARWRHDGTITA